MGQEDVFEILKNSKKPLTTFEIAKRLKKSRSPISVCLKKLRQQNMIGMKEYVRPKFNNGGYRGRKFYYFVVKK